MKLASLMPINPLDSDFSGQDSAILHLNIWDQAPVARKIDSAVHQSLVGQTLNNVIHRINHYPADKY